MKYTINPGYSFLDSDGTVKTGGDTIEVSDDEAKSHAEKLVALPEIAATVAADPHPAE